MVTRYEHIELDISTATCAAILEALLVVHETKRSGWSQVTYDEITNLTNELRARLQRRDLDPHCPKNAPSLSNGGWLDI